LVSHDFSLKNLVFRPGKADVKKKKEREYQIDISTAADGKNFEKKG
jgi:hypothetical protein